MHNDSIQLTLYRKRFIELLTMSHCRFHDKIDLSFPLKYHFILFWKGGYRGRGWIQRDGKMNGLEMYDLKVTKDKLKCIYI